MVENERYRKRFEAEAKAVAPIHHPNIVSVFAIGEDKGFHYIALEYVQGVNLREYLVKKGTLALPVGLNIIKRVALALQCAHDAGIIHRDIKPENVLLTKKGEVKVADFGLCRQATEENVSLTQTGMTMGTPLYMSSEQIRGEHIDHRTDIFSFGVMCYHMLAGETPFRGETAMAVAVQIERGKPIPLSEHRPDLPRELIDLVEKMMAKSPSDRYQSAKDVLRQVARLQGKSASTSKTDTRRPDAKATGDSTTADNARRATKRALVGPVRTTASLLVTPGRRPWVTVGLLLVALSAGGALGWSERAPSVLEDQRLPSKQAKLPPSGVGVPEKTTAWLQLDYVRLILDPGQREAGLWTVLVKFPGDIDETIEAAQELMNLYIEERRYDDAMALGDWLLVRDNEDKQQVFGHLIKGIVQSRQDEPQESNDSFRKMFAIAPRADMHPDQRQWLARQYLLALYANSESIDGSPDSAMADKFWEAFQPSGPRGGGGP